MTDPARYSQDTIAAIATPLGLGGLALIRVSGPRSVKIVEKIFSSKKGYRLSACRSHSIHYGFIVEPENNKKTSAAKLSVAGGTKKGLIDEVLVTLMLAPATYTREDIVEISSHGGIVPARRILKLILEQGARLAEPGEFTRRAFTSGRIDLVQAEAVCDIINAKTEKSLDVAISHLEGSLSKSIKNIRHELIELASSLEAAIDFSADKIDIISHRDAHKAIKACLGRLEGLLATADEGIILNEGFSVVICGRANTGKSSLMNALLRMEKVIVTPSAGTTRDAIEEYINLGGIAVKLTDTAGLLKPKDEVEKISIGRSKDYVSSADLIVLVLDASCSLKADDKRIIEYISGKNIIVVLNKSDLKSRLDIKEVSKRFKGSPVIKASAQKGQNIKKIEKAIVAAVSSGHNFSLRGPVISNIRHQQALRAARGSLMRAENSAKNKLSFEFIVIDVKEAICRLGEITGEDINNKILDNIFSQFCIGK